MQLVSLILIHWVVISPVDSTIQCLKNQGLNTLQKGKMFGSSCTTSKSKCLVCKGQCRPSSADCAVLVLCVLKNSAVNLCWRYKNKKCSNPQWGLAWAYTCKWFEFIYLVLSIIRCVRKVRVRLLSNVHIFRGKNTVLHVIITMTKLSNLIGYQLPWFQP